MRNYLYLIATDRVNGAFALIVKSIMRLLSWIYRLLVALRMILYRARLKRSFRLSCPVISVGNLTMGGSGKTPLVEFLAKSVKDMDRKPVILTRGYMEGRKNIESQASDEALMLQDTLGDVPVLVGADRVKNAQTYLEHNHADVMILDDGFQHYRLKRDLDIVIVDATNPWGNGRLLPRGILREPIAALKRAGIIVITKVNLAEDAIDEITERIRSVNSGCLIVLSVHQPVEFFDLKDDRTVKLEALQGARIATLSSIGSPVSFERTLQRLGANVKKHFAFNDHYQYTEEDMHQVFMCCQDERLMTLVATHKDVVKLKHFWSIIPHHLQLLMLKIKIKVVDNEEAFLERVHHIL